MDLIEKYAIAPVVIFMAWVGSFEWRLRNKVSKDLFKQNNDNYDERLSRGVDRFDKNDKLLADLNKEQVEQGKVLIKVFTIVERMEKNNGGK